MNRFNLEYKRIMIKLNDPDRKSEFKNGMLDFLEKRSLAGIEITHERRLGYEFATKVIKGQSPGVQSTVRTELIKSIKKSTDIAEQSSPNLQKAQLQKIRADRQQLSQQQKQLSQSRKNIKDTPTKARLSQQIADLGSKKAKLGVQAAQQSQALKTKPKMAKNLKEGHPERIRLKELLPVEETLIYEADSDIIDDLLVIAKNERNFYDKRDAIGAIEFAYKLLEKEKLTQLRQELKLALPLAKRKLADYWTQEDKNR